MGRNHDPAAQLKRSKSRDSRKVLKSQSTLTDSGNGEGITDSVYRLHGWTPVWVFLVQIPPPF